MNARITPFVRFATALLLLLPGTARAIVAGDPNGTPSDSPDAPYNATTRTGRLDSLGLSSPFSGVGSVNGGTGTLIDSTHVLTAAHLFNQGFSNTGATFVLDAGNGATVSLQSSRVAVHPLYPNGLGQDDLYDIAVVTLSAPAPVAFRTFSLFNGPLTPGTTLTLVGYGATGDGVHGYGAYQGGRRVGQNNVDAYLLPGGALTETYQPSNPTYEFDFDGPDATTNVFGDSGTPGNLTLGNDRETTLGGGDSGGPAFIFADGQYQIAAINNFVDKYGTADNPRPDYGFFGSGGGGAIVSAYSEFISGAVSPTPEPGSIYAFGVGAAFVLAALGRARKVRSAA